MVLTIFISQKAFNSPTETILSWQHFISLFLFLSRSTILVSLDIRENSKELIFEPGDHVAIFPANRASLMQDLVDLTHEKPDPNWPIRIEVAREDPSKPWA